MVPVIDPKQWMLKRGPSRHPQIATVEDVSPGPAICWLEERGERSRRPNKPFSEWCRPPCAYLWVNPNNERESRRPDGAARAFPAMTGMINFLTKECTPIS